MEARPVDPQTLNRWLREGQASRIAGAELHPLSRLDAGALAARPGRLVIHCLKGGRGQKACEKLLAENPALEIYNLSGGIEAWAGAGLPVAKGSRNVLPLDRQVQLTIGLTLLVATTLALFVNPAFVILAGLVGVGLTIAGMTGFCGMALVLARMPWNRS